MSKAVLTKSTRPNKKLKVVITNAYGKMKTIHFGQRGSRTYLDHKDIDIKFAYIKRHKKRENWNDPYTAGFWSRWILWNKPTLRGSIMDIKRKYGISINF